MSLFVAAGVAGMMLGMPGGESVRQQPIDLPALATTLDLSETGVRWWLAQLGVAAQSPPLERLLGVSPTGELLLTRRGGSSFVRLDGELETLLARPETSLVLVHNHPRNVGLSYDDLRVLAKPGVAAIVAIGHDGSVFLASAGPGMTAGEFRKLYARTAGEVRKKLQSGWLSRRVPVEVRDAHFSHLVTAALARAGVVHYWVALRGPARQTFDRGRLFFNWVVVGAAERVKRDKRRPPQASRSGTRAHSPRTNGSRTTGHDTFTLQLLLPSELPS